MLLSRKQKVPDFPALQMKVFFFNNLEVEYFCNSESGN